MCSSNLQHTLRLVNDTGRQLLASCLLPFLKIGDTFALRQSLGKVPVVRLRLLAQISVRVHIRNGQNIYAHGYSLFVHLVNKLK